MASHPSKLVAVPAGAPAEAEGPHEDRNPGTALDRSGHPNPVPRIVGKVRRKHPVEVRDVQFLRANTDRAIKMTVPGPFTMSQQAQNDYYKDAEEMVLDYAAAVNAEIKDLFAAGADIVQIDEPYMQARPERAREFGLKAFNAALAGVTGTISMDERRDARKPAVVLEMKEDASGQILPTYVSTIEPR